MIIYKDILKKLSEAGWSTYRLRKNKVLSSSTIDKIRAGENITIESIDIICRLCQCQPGDLLGYKDSE